jgi:hypothetical protein
MAPVLQLENKAIGLLEEPRFYHGRKNYNYAEINGKDGSIQRDFENMNNLWLFWKD